VGNLNEHREANGKKKRKAGLNRRLLQFPNDRSKTRREEVSFGVLFSILFRGNKCAQDEKIGVRGASKKEEKMVG